MGHNPRSINEGRRNIDLEARERDRALEYRQAHEMAAFLRNLTSMEQESASNRRICPLSPATNHALVISMISHQDQGYAFYRQKYLVMYNPFKTFRNDGAKKSQKDKILKWFARSLKKQHDRKKAESSEPNHIFPSESEDKPLPPTFFESALKFFRCIVGPE